MLNLMIPSDFKYSFQTLTVCPRLSTVPRIGQRSLHSVIKCLYLFLTAGYDGFNSILLILPTFPLYWPSLLLLSTSILSCIYLINRSVLALFNGRGRATRGHSRLEVTTSPTFSGSVIISQTDACGAP